MVLMLTVGGMMPEDQVKVIVISTSLRAAGPVATDVTVAEALGSAIWPVDGSRVARWFTHCV
jgi:hypothetical protein